MRSRSITPEWRDKVRARMVRLGMSQSNLSLATMVSTCTISQILSGHIHNSRFVDSIEHALGLDVAEPSGAELPSAEPSGAELDRAEPIGTASSGAEPDCDDPEDAEMYRAAALIELDTLNAKLRTLAVHLQALERARDRAALRIARMRGFK